MSLSDYMRRLIDLANGKSEETTPRMLNENAGSTAKNFSRWGSVNEAWGGEPGSDSVHVYQDMDPMGSGEWFWTRSKNGHIVAQGHCPTEGEAEAEANMREEDVLMAPELDEGGKMNAEWTAGMPPFSEEEQDALAGYKAGGGPQEGVHEFIASIRNGTAYDELNQPISPEDQARAEQALADMRDDFKREFPHMVDEEAEDAVHLLRPRGGSECGAPVDHENCTAEINDVTCPDCIKGHDDYMDKFEMHEKGIEEEGFDYHLDKMFNEHQKSEAKALNEGLEVERITGPAYWASYLVNGDDSGLEPDEKAAADAWLDKIAPYYVVDVGRHEDGEGEDSRFTWSYDLHGGTAQGGDVIDYICHKDASAEPAVAEEIVDEAADSDGFKQKDGTVIPYGEWHKVSDKISILPKKTTYYIRYDLTGQIVKPAGPASKDSLMMALYYNKEPTGYAFFCFGPEAMESPNFMLSVWRNGKKDAKRQMFRDFSEAKKYAESELRASYGLDSVQIKNMQDGGKVVFLHGKEMESVFEDSDAEERAYYTKYHNDAYAKAQKTNPKNAGWEAWDATNTHRREREASKVTEEGGAGLHVDYVLDIDELPEECVQDCGAGSGAKDEAVEYWRKKLNFTVNREKAIDCLEGYGSWEREELEAASDDEIADKILWLACSNFAEWDGKEGDSNSGSCQFVLEGAEALGERIDGLGALGPMQGFDAQTTSAQRSMHGVMQRSADNTVKSPLDVPLTQAQQDRLALNNKGYNMLDVANAPRISPEEAKYKGNNVNIKV